eukprot:scaffold7327_cov141-Isochrysis_galbana.AAC.5
MARRRGDGRGGALAGRLERVRHAVSFTTDRSFRGALIQSGEIEQSPNWEVRASTGKMETSASQSAEETQPGSEFWPRIGVQRA